MQIPMQDITKGNDFHEFIFQDCFSILFIRQAHMSALQHTMCFPLSCLPRVHKISYFSVRFLLDLILQL